MPPVPLVFIATMFSTAFCLACLHSVLTLGSFSTFNLSLLFTWRLKVVSLSYTLTRFFCSFFTLLCFFVVEL